MTTRKVLLYQLLLPGLGTRDAGADDTGQLLTSHIVQHADGASNQHGHSDAERSKQDERRADVFLLTSRATPLDRLLRAVGVDAGESRAAFALEAAGVRLVALAMAGAEVRGVFTRRLRREAGRDHRG